MPCLLASVPGTPFSYSNVCADGPADNIATSVRPIPPIGIQIDGNKIESLRKRCQQIRKAWQQTLAEASQTIEASKGWQRDAAIKRLDKLSRLTPEILVFPRSVEMAIELNQFYAETEAEHAGVLLDEANRRIALAKQDASWAKLVGITDGQSQTLVIGGFESKIDGSYQPYALVVPAGFSASDSRPRRLDLWFHGRGEKLSELNFLWTGSNNAGQYTPAETFVLHPYGRYSNAFKFAGEVDVLEALEYLQTRLPVDPQRISARGFSMGGAACWQFATHYADRFFAANPGAGFSETPEFLKSFQQEDLSETPDYQRTLWQLYDCPPWSRNLIHCSTVAYSGGIDRQKQAADVMDVSLAEQGIDLVHVIGPETAHQIHADSKIEIESRMAQLAAMADGNVPNQVDLTTYTLRYNRMHWVHLTGLQQHWQRSHVTASLNDAGHLTIETTNATKLELSFASGQWQSTFPCQPSITIDGSELVGPPVRSDRSWSIKLVRHGDTWAVDDSAGNALRKRPGMQGPIDDALMDSFLFVLPSKSSKDKTFQQWAESEAQHAMVHWRKHFRGDIRVVHDNEVTKDMIMRHHLIAFGDPDSNSLLARLQDGLPMRWENDAIVLGDHRYPRSSHAGILIYPNPSNPDKYIVANSGFTFREYDYLNNARQTPKLPDWAIVDITEGATTRAPGKVIDAGFFNESWQVQ
ncbi:hypothetical protein CGZ80_12170 [Rhodopirellula sp. MGV]|nr:hypothetical protein CGZ80_12170 [Rhodopirellula sp. MGV]PNY36787.1 hypothetical protein C2E31_11215 [Rhodopirellula baltica]